MMKRGIALLMTLVMLVGMLPVFAQAQEEPTTAVNNGDLTVEGTNGFGNLLAEDLAQEQETMEAQQATGYTLTNLEITDNTATVTYDSMEEAVVVVAIYSEDGMQLITSGSTTVSPDETQATVTIEEEFPEYFLASAYLLDSYDLSPLCPAYETPLYTWEMQFLQSATVEDFGEEYVLQLGDSTDTNFAVYGPNTTVIYPVEGVNTVMSVDNEAMVYVIENADEQITSLESGSIFAYHYGVNQVLIVKVAEMDMDGNTVTITGGELEIDEVFGAVKVESIGTNEEMTVDDSTAYEGITYLGLTQEPQARTARAIEDSVSKTASHTFDIGVQATADSEYVEGSVSINGSLRLDITVSLDYYIWLDMQYVRFYTQSELHINTYMKGSAKVKLPMGVFDVAPVPGVVVGFTPKLVLEVSGSVTVDNVISMTFGFAYDHLTKFQNLTTKPNVDTIPTVEGTLAIGVDWYPNISVVVDDKEILVIALSIPTVFEIGAKTVGSDYEDLGKDPKSRHACEKCIQLSLSFKISLNGELKILNQDWLSVPVTFASITLPVCDGYYSHELGRFGFGTCPNLAYRVTVDLTDHDGNPASGVEITALNGLTAEQTSLGTTNSKGVLIAYLPVGYYQLTANREDTWAVRNMTVSGACFASLRLSPDLSPEEFPELKPNQSANRPQTGGQIYAPWLDPEKQEQLEHFGTLIASGICGDGLKWKLYSTGTLYISGTGVMEDYHISLNHGPMSPWYSYRTQIQKAVINNGVTGIGNCAFYQCIKLSEVTIPGSVTTIGSRAFSDCTGLTAITLPEGVTTIGSSAFSDCTGLTVITLPEGVTTLGDSLFYKCSKLTAVTLPDSVMRVGAGLVYGCTSIKTQTYGNVEYLGKGDNPYYAALGADRSAYEYTIHPDTKIIADNAFGYSRNLTSITIPQGVIAIGKWAFSSCDNLYELRIPDSVTAIGPGITYSSENITGIWVGENNASYTSDSLGILFNKDQTVLLQAPAQLSGSYVVAEGVTEIGGYAFSYCKGLTSVTLPNSVTNIGESAFYYCNGLVSATLPNGITNIQSDTFFSCTALTEITIPDSVTAIDDDAFAACESLASVIIPDSVISIGRAFASCIGLKEVVIGSNLTTIGDQAFSDCSSLVSVNIPDSVIRIGEMAFCWCTSLKEVTIGSNVAVIDESAFCYLENLTDVYYRGTQGQWGAIDIRGGNGRLTNATIHYLGSAASTLSASTFSMIPTAKGVFGGETGTEDWYKNADFEGLVPGEEYVLLVLKSLDEENLVYWENLLFIGQAAAEEDGTLSFQYYPREETDGSYVMACGASDLNLEDAQITFPEMIADGETQAVHPAVVYDGKTLTEGVDYVINGDVDFAEAGEYTCYIRGIYNYTGLVTCTYRVKSEGVVQPTLTLKSPTLEFKDMITVNAMFTAENIDDVV